MKMSSKHIFLGIVFLAFLVMLQLLYDPISLAEHRVDVWRIQLQLPKARAQWKAAGITSYSFSIRSDERSICKPSARVTVEGGEVVMVELMDFTVANPVPRSLPPDRWFDPDWGDEAFLCDYRHFNMDRIFTMLEGMLTRTPNAVLKVEFDPQYGFITHYADGFFFGRGLLTPKVGDCCSGFWIEDFQAQP